MSNQVRNEQSTGLGYTWRSDSAFRLSVRNSNNSTVILEPNFSNDVKNLVGSKVVVNVQNGKALYRILNPTGLSIKLNRNKKIAKAFEVDKNGIFALNDKDSIDKSIKVNKSQNVEKELGITINENLNSNQRQQLAELLTRNRKVFAKDITELGKTDYHYHRIDTGDVPPVQSMPYRQTPQMRKETEKHIDIMLKNDIIEESNSPWSSPIVLVRKKKNNNDAKQEFRFAVDYRRLNKCTLRAKFSIPRIDDVFDTVANSKAVIYSVLDLMSGFFQTPLDPETKHKSAFVTHQVDASDYAIGYVLGQLNPNTKLEHVVAYGGRSLNKNEQKWHINEKEGLALKEGIKHFNPYLATQKFTVYTDNITVRWIDTIKNIQGRLGRWALELQGYDFEIMHRPGKKNNADALSRREYEKIYPENFPQNEIEQTVAAMSNKKYEIITFDYKGDDEQQPNILTITDTGNEDDETLEDIDPEQFKKLRWTGPFTITNLGPPDCNTFKLRRDSDNKISKKLVNASRLKVFNSKTDRPDYLLDDTDDPFEEDEDENQQVQNEGTENQTQDTISNSQPKNAPRNNQNKNCQSKLSKQNKAVPPDNSIENKQNTNKTAQQATTEIQITPDDVEKIISSAWVNKKLCYKIKIKNMSKTEWVHQDKIPENMRREFHKNRTHTGKKRKRPLQENKHKFFEPSNETQNVTAIDQNSDAMYKQRPKINWDKFPVQAVKLENNRFFVKTILRNNTISHYQPLNRVNGEDQHAFTILLAYFYGDQFYNIMLALTGNSQTKVMGPSCFLTGSHITHFKIENNVPKCFIHYEQKHIYDPEWVPFETCPPGLLKNFQDKYEDEWLRCYN
ncbi:unnamed protein product [Mytilus coruscus]|uniref:Reverse transcriptase RNase H-like domain-containing protein n=1 Tax=Mytilus coruscus TaxID=42192 RepID=A0A6J8AD29_MYTCO|nr:unnamed protein product [Mytilus coruscus]